MDTAMRWTKEKPTATGWYWYRGDYDPSGKEAQPLVVHMDTEGKVLLLSPRAWKPFTEYPDLDVLNGEWAGPIEPPAT